MPGVVVAVLWALTALILFLVGRSQIKQVKGVPQTVDTLKEIPETLKRNEENRGAIHPTRSAPTSSGPATTSAGTWTPWPMRSPRRRSWTDRSTRSVAPSPPSGSV